MSDTLFHQMSNFMTRKMRYGQEIIQATVVNDNGDGTYDVVLKGNSGQMKRVPFVGQGTLRVNDTVMIANYDGDRQRPQIVIGAGAQSTPNPLKFDVAGLGTWIGQGRAMTSGLSSFQLTQKRPALQSASSPQTVDMDPSFNDFPPKLCGLNGSNLWNVGGNSPPEVAKYTYQGPSNTTPPGVTFNATDGGGQNIIGFVDSAGVFAYSVDYGAGLVRASLHDSSGNQVWSVDLPLDQNSFDYACTKAGSKYLLCYVTSISVGSYSDNAYNGLSINPPAVGIITYDAATGAATVTTQDFHIDNGVGDALSSWSNTQPQCDGQNFYIYMLRFIPTALRFPPGMCLETTTGAFGRWEMFPGCTPFPANYGGGSFLSPPYLIPIEVPINLFQQPGNTCVDFTGTCDVPRLCGWQGIPTGFQTTQGDNLLITTRFATSPGPLALIFQITDTSGRAELAIGSEHVANYFSASGVNAIVTVGTLRLDVVTANASGITVQTIKEFDVPTNIVMDHPTYSENKWSNVGFFTVQACPEDNANNTNLSIYCNVHCAENNEFSGPFRYANNNLMTAAAMQFNANPRTGVLTQMGSTQISDIEFAPSPPNLTSFNQAGNGLYYAGVPVQAYDQNGNVVWTAPVAADAANIQWLTQDYICIYIGPNFVVLNAADGSVALDFTPPGHTNIFGFGGSIISPDGTIAFASYQFDGMGNPQMILSYFK